MFTPHASRLTLCLAFWIFGSCGLFAASVPRPASQAAVNAGTDQANFVSPYTLANKPGGGGGDGGATNNVFYPRTYGAVGDGVADDTTAMLACVAAQNLTTGARMDLAAGVYNVESSLVFTNWGMQLYNGKIVTANNTIKLLDVRGHRSKISRVSLGGPGTNFNSASIGINIDAGGGSYIGNVVLEEIKATNFWFGVKANLAYDLQINNSVISACASNSIYADLCDSLVIDGCALGMASTDLLFLPDPGYGDLTSQTNGWAFYIRGGISATVQNCDMANTGSGGMVRDVTHFKMEHCNFEQFFNTSRVAFVTVSNSGFHIEGNKFNKFITGADLAGVYVLNGPPGRMHFGANAMGATARVPVEIYPAYPLPYIQGFWGDNNNNNIILAHAVLGDAGTVRGQTVVAPYPLQDALISQFGLQQFGAILGGTLDSFGVTAGVGKNFSFATPAFADNSMVGFMRVFSTAATDQTLVLGSADYGTAMRYVDIKVASGNTHTNPIGLFRFSESGLTGYPPNLAIQFGPGSTIFGGTIQTTNASTYTLTNTANLQTATLNTTGNLVTGGLKFNDVGGRMDLSFGATVFQSITAAQLLFCGQSLALKSAGGGGNTGEVFLDTTSVGNLRIGTNVFARGSITATNGFLVSSNSMLTVPTLAEGENWYFSSNAIPHVRYRLGGANITVRLVP